MPFRVLLDYAHNAHGMEAMAKTVREMPVHGRRIGVVSAPGDRRDEDILELARAAAPGFDLILLREDDDRRGRRPGAIGEMLRAGLIEAGFPAERIARRDPAARRRPSACALETAQPGDLLVIFGDKLDRELEPDRGLRPSPGRGWSAEERRRRAPLRQRRRPAGHPRHQRHRPGAAGQGSTRTSRLLKKSV